MSVLRAESLRKRFKSRTVVTDVSIEVASGEVVGLLGPNGAGKTTCFYMIVGLVPADAGRIHLDSQELTRLEEDLQRAVAQERFEEAAHLRDRIVICRAQLAADRGAT